MRKEDRLYWNKSRWVPSGTTVLPWPYLAEWSANCAVDYIIQQGQNGVGLEFAAMSPAGNELAGNIWDKARTAFERESTEAADYGTYIHTLCGYSLKHNMELELLHDMTDKFMKGFWKWKTKHKVKVIATERAVLTDTYGGRLDLVCEMDGVVTLVDFKTGKSSYYDTWKVQLAGYRQAWNYMTKPYPICNHPEIQNSVVLKFNKETGKVNYKSFNKYQATRTNPKTKEKEKYTRTYEMDRLLFNSYVKSWWLKKRGIEI